MHTPNHIAINRRRFIQGLGLTGLAACSGLPLWGRDALAAPTEDLTVWGIPASPSVVIARAVASGALSAKAPDLKFDVWKSTDQMRAGIATGQFKLFATSSYAAANFHNRGAGTKLINIMTWGVLYIMSRTPDIQKVEDLAGKNILLSNKNEAPDLLFRLVLKWSGLDPDKDVSLDYVGSPGEAVPLYLAGRGDIALLHEPAATAALFRAAKQKLPLYRALDVTEIYGTHTGRGPKIPQVGLAVNGDFLEKNPELVASLHHAMVNAGHWAMKNQKEAGHVAGDKLRLPPPIISKSLPFIRLDVQSAFVARDDIELYFEHLMSLDPAIVGGKQPDRSFYWGEGV